MDFGFTVNDTLRVCIVQKMLFNINFIEMLNNFSFSLGDIFLHDVHLTFNGKRHFCLDLLFHFLQFEKIITEFFLYLIPNKRKYRTPCSNFRIIIARVNVIKFKLYIIYSKLNIKIAILKNI
jgi:hypothetical protein